MSIIARLYKVEMYITDIEDDYVNTEQLKNHLEYALDRTYSIMKLSKIEASRKFEWDDDLKINLVKATNEDYEEYFK